MTKKYMHFGMRPVNNVPYFINSHYNIKNCFYMLTE